MRKRRACTDFAGLHHMANKTYQIAIIALAGLPVWASAQAIGGNWTQSFGDEFNTGASDLNGWTYDLGNNNGWGNGEKEVYTNSTNNVSVSGGGLHIDAISSGTGTGATFTSGRIRTTSLFSQSYGLFEFRAKLPAGQGLWPALWMMPQSSVYGGWPTSGEVDVLESTGQNNKLVQGSLHSGVDSGHQDTQTQTFQGSGLEPAGFSTNDFHTYDLEWSRGNASTPGTFNWYVDGIKYESQTGGWVVPGGLSSSNHDAPFDQPFYIIMNMAVGGNFVGNPSLPTGAYDMQVDYVRAYTATPAPEPATLAALGVGLGLLIQKKKSHR